VNKSTIEDCCTKAGPVEKAERLMSNGTAYSDSAFRRETTTGPEQHVDPVRRPALTKLKGGRLCAGRPESVPSRAYELMTVMSALICSMLIACTWLEVKALP
jgi:hypothetical protein